MTVILEAVDTALRIFLHVRAWNRIAVVIRVLLALAVTRAVVRGVVRRMHAVFAGLRLLMPGVSRRWQLGVLRAENETVRADGLRGMAARLNAANAEHQHESDCGASHHAATAQQAALHLL